MAISIMSLKTASNIEELYTGLFAKEPKVGKYKFYKYSEIDHYDIIDILNAFKILTAYKIFNSKTVKDIGEIKEYVNLAGGLCMLFTMHFGPDEIAEKISHLNKNDKLSISEFLQLKNEIPKHKDWGKSETLSSFMNYLLTLDRKDQNFWEKVYNSIGISWDKNDPDDRITFIINNKGYFFRNEIITPKEKSQNNPKDLKRENKSIYRKYKYFFDQVLTYILFCLSIFFPVVRVIVFSLMTLMVGLKIYFWIEEPIKQKNLFFLNLIQFSLFLGSVFLSSLTLYAIGFTIFTTISDILRGTYKNYNSD